MNARATAAIFALIALAGCTNTRWEGANASQEEVDWNLKSCADRQRAQMRQIFLPHPTVGTAAVMIAPQGSDVDSCMRARGFVPATEKSTKSTKAD